MTPNETRSRAWTLVVALAIVLPWALACSSDAGPTGPADLAGIEEISEAEILAAGDLEGLTEEQREQVRDILRQARQELLRLRDAVRAGEVTPERARELAREIHERAIRRLSEFLTDEQIGGLFDRLRERRHDRPELDLTEEQRAAIEALRVEFRAFVQAIREEVREGTLSAAEAREAIRAEWREMHEAICGILTEEQAGEVPFCAGEAPAGPGGPGGGPGHGPGPGPGGGPPGS